MALPNLQNLQPNLADLLKDEGYEQLRAFLDEHDIDPSDEVAILATIRERGWEPVITGTTGDWEIEIFEPGPSGPIQSHVLLDADRQRVLLRALDMTLWWSTTTAARESFDRNTRTMLWAGRAALEQPVDTLW
jgi:hypothetical protein